MNERETIIVGAALCELFLRLPETRKGARLLPATVAELTRAMAGGQPQAAEGEVHELMLRHTCGQTAYETQQHLDTLTLPDALWWFTENIGDDHPARTELYFYLRNRRALEST